jgi:hypothetical protein
LSGTTLPNAIALFVACLRPIARTSSICPEIVGKNSGKDAPFPLLAEAIFLATYSGSNRIIFKRDRRHCYTTDPKPLVLRIGYSGSEFPNAGNSNSIFSQLA